VQDGFALKRNVGGRCFAKETATSALYVQPSSELRKSIAPDLQELGRFHVPIVPMRVKAPVAGLMVNMDTLFELEFVT